MKILHVITTINRGGAENHLRDLAIGQAIKGHQVTIAFLKGDGFWKRNLTDNGVLIVDLLMKYYGDLLPVLKLAKLIRQWKPSIIHSHMPPAELYTVLAKIISLNRTPYVVSKHNIERFCPGHFNFVLFNLANKICNHYIAISGAVNTYLQSKGINSKNITTVYYGINPDTFTHCNTHFRSEYNIPSNTFIFGTVCRLEKQKSVDVLLNAYAEFSHKNPDVSKLCIVGSGSLDSQLKCLSNKLGIDSDVIWTGQRNDIPDVMNAFNCFVLSSSYEGFGLVLIEAMASSLPVIATNVCSIPEIVSDNNTGFLVEPNRPLQLASCMERVLSKSVQETFGRNGFHKVVDNFNLNTMIEKTGLVYKQVIKCVE